MWRTLGVAVVVFAVGYWLGIHFTAGVCADLVIKRCGPECALRLTAPHR